MQGDAKTDRIEEAARVAPRCKCGNPAPPTVNVGAFGYQVLCLECKQATPPHRHLRDALASWRGAQGIAEALEPLRRGGKAKTQ